MIVANEDVALQSFVSWLEQQLHAAPSISSLVKDIADLVWKNNKTLYVAVMPCHNTQALGTRTRKSLHLSSLGKKTKKTKQVPDSLPSMPLTCKALISKSLEMAQLALVIRETLNFRRGHHWEDEYLRQYLEI